MTYDLSNSYDFSKHRWFSPQLVIGAVGRIAKLYGNNIESEREFQKVREMFDASVALLGAYNLHPSNKYFLQLNLQSNSPDVVAVKQTEIANSPVLLEVTQLEIVRMDNHSSTNDVVKFLKETKLSSKKAYDDRTLIVCVIGKKIQINKTKIIRALKKINPKPTVYILGKLKGGKKKWIIFSPHPSPTRTIVYGILETTKKYSIPSVINLRRGIKKEISYEKISPRKTTIYDIFNLKESDLEKYKK